ncbi:MAG: thioredoxin family protein [Acidobacteriota bacterium]
MRKTTALFLGTVIVSITICVVTSAQSSPARRTPVLTNDDLGSAPREVVRLPAESDAQPAKTRDPEVVPGSIAWQRDLRRAFHGAKADGKLIVVDVYTDWCGWCKKMDKTIYTDPAIVALSRQQVFVKVNAEDRGEGQSFAKDMGVNGYPTTIILDGQGRVLNIAEGYIPSPQAFLDFVERARSAQAR